MSPPLTRASTLNVNDSDTPPLPPQGRDLAMSAKGRAGNPHARHWSDTGPTSQPGLKQEHQAAALFRLYLIVSSFVHAESSSLSH